MGNHNVGRTFAAVFELIDSQEGRLENMSKEDLLSLLDAVGNKFKGADAEFDDYASPAHGHPFSKVLIKIFAPEIEPYKNLPLDIEDPDIDEYDDGWYEKVYLPFKERYNFC